MVQERVNMVTHAGDGIYLSKGLAAIYATILSASVIGVFANLMYLNKEATLFRSHIEQVQSSSYALPGALPRSEFEYEKRALVKELTDINKKLDERTADNKVLLSEMTAMGRKIDSLVRKAEST